MSLSLFLGVEYRPQYPDLWLTGHAAGLRHAPPFDSERLSCPCSGPGDQTRSYTGAPDPIFGMPGTPPPPPLTFLASSMSRYLSG